MARRRIQQDLIVDGHRVMDRPQGFYYQSLVGGELHGPFDSAAEALDRIEGVTLAEAEEDFADEHFDRELDAYADTAEF